eukprot:scaffold548_cov152-Isochrysis_galbana.AAC.2
MERANTISSTSPRRWHNHPQTWASRSLVGKLEALSQSLAIWHVSHLSPGFGTMEPHLLSRTD